MQELRLALVVLLVGLCSLSALAAESSPRTHRMVFAHYMVCCPFGGRQASRELMAEEIRVAQEYRIDGFALNVGAWNQEPENYPPVLDRLFSAAELVGSEFWLFISADPSTGLTPDEVSTILERYSTRKNYLHVNGRAVLSTYGGNPEWLARLRELLLQRNISIFFVPAVRTLNRTGLSGLGQGQETPGPDFFEELMAGDLAFDGYFYFGAAGSGDSIAASTSAAAHVLLPRGKFVMAPVTPLYRGYNRNNRVFENGGFQSMEAQWLAAINGGVQWVQIVTWNDWGESTYVRPAESVVFNPGPGWPTLLSHNAYLRASQRYIAMFKEDKRLPRPLNEVHVFFRPHPATVCTTTDVDVPAPCPKGVLSLRNALYVITELDRPGTLEVRIADKSWLIDVPAGWSQFDRPLTTFGDIHMKLSVDGIVKEWQAPLPYSLENSIYRHNYLAVSF